MIGGNSKKKEKRRSKKKWEIKDVHNVRKINILKKSKNYICNFFSKQKNFFL